ncbi:unnamed protein product [Musa textilis]
MNVAGKRKTSKGRQKIKLEKIEKPAARYVSFTKRKHGSFSKASDLCTLCGTEVAVVVFSPAGRPFSFGCPDVERVVDRFLSSNPIPASGSHARRQTGDGDVNHRVTELRKQIDGEKARKTALREQLTAVSRGLESLDNLDGVDLPVLDALAEMLVHVKTQAANRVVQIMTGSGASSSNAAAFVPGGVAPIDSRGRWVQPMLNPVLPVEEFSTGPWAASSNAVAVNDRVGTSSLDWMANEHWIGQGYRSVVNPVQPVEESSTDPRASSSNAFVAGDHVGDSGTIGIATVDSRWRGFRPDLNPVLPVEEFSTDPRASSPEAAAVADHAGASSSSGGIMNVDPRWQGFQSILNPIPPVREFSTDPRASSPEAAAVADRAGASSSSGGITNVDPRWQGFQSILNPMPPIKEFSTDPRASSSDADTTNDNVGNSGTIGIATVDSRWQSFRPVQSPVPPTEFFTDWRAFSPNAAAVVDHTGRNGIVDSIGQGFQSVPRNPVQPIKEIDQKASSANGEGKMVVVDSEWQGFQPRFIR